MNAHRHPDLLQLLQRALREGGDTHTAQDVAAARQAGDAPSVADPAGQAFIITEVLAHPRRSVLRVWLAGGRLPALRALLPDLEELARLEGCTGLVAYGRPGWMAEAARHGWTARAIVYTKELQT